MGRSMDNLTAEQRSKTMRAIRSQDTQIEMLLRRELTRRGHRYRVHYAPVAGEPDIAFPAKKVAIFCDGEFFHGYQWRRNRRRIHSNRAYWIPKIERNIRRDAAVTRGLEREGWIVLRFWGHEIRNDLERCIRKVEVALSKGHDSGGEKSM